MIFVPKLPWGFRGEVQMLAATDGAGETGCAGMLLTGGTGEKLALSPAEEVMRAVVGGG